MPIGPIAASRRRTASPPSDPFFANVVLLCGFEGPDGSTTFDDESNSNHPLTYYGTAQIDTAQFKFGASSYFQSSSSTSAINLLSSAGSADFGFGSGDLTMEAWVRFNSLGDARPIFTRWNGNTGGVKHFVFGYEPSVGGLWFAWIATGGGFHMVTGAWSPSINTWYHVAVSRTGNTFRLFVDGNQVGTATDSADILPALVQIPEVGFYIDGTEERYDGWIDELRITKGVGRYTAGFTPPTAAFPRS